MACTHIHRFGRVDSTLNVLARQFGEAEDFTTVVASHQTQGRGRSGRSWCDDAGQSLLFSTLVRVLSEHLNWVVPIAGMAMQQSLAEQGIQSELKWPNDIIYRGRKICGILCEHLEIFDQPLPDSSTPDPWKSEIRIHSIALGVGLNLGTLPGEAGIRAASLGIPSAEIAEAKETILHSFLRILMQILSQENPMQWRRDYTRSLGHLGQPSTVHLASGRQIRVIPTDIDSEASLIARGEQGEKLCISVADVDLPGWVKADRCGLVKPENPLPKPRGGRRETKPPNRNQSIERDLSAI